MNQSVNTVFVLSFQDEPQRKSHKRYYLSTVEINDYNIMIEGQNLFDQPVRHMIVFEKLKQVKEVIIQLVIFWTIISSKTIIGS